MRPFVLACLLALGCVPVKLDGFLYDPMPGPAGGYQLSTAIIPAWQDVRIATSDGETLQGAFIAAAPVAGTRPDVTLIYFHGQSNNVGSTWPRLELLYPLGVNILAVDVRGYGFSTGSPDEPGIDRDVEAIWQAATGTAAAPPSALTPVAANHVVIYGRSLGAAFAIQLAATHAPGALVTESAFASVAALVSDGTYLDLPRSFVARSAWDNLAKIGRVPSPYLALHGDADPYVQPRYSEQLRDAHAAGAPMGVETTLILVPGADHGNVPEKQGLDEYRRVLAQLFARSIP